MITSSINTYTEMLSVSNYWRKRMAKLMFLTQGWMLKVDNTNAFAKASKVYHPDPLFWITDLLNSCGVFLGQCKCNFSWKLHGICAKKVVMQRHSTSKTFSFFLKIVFPVCILEIIYNLNKVSPILFPHCNLPLSIHRNHCIPVGQFRLKSLLCSLSHW